MKAQECRDQSIEELMLKEEELRSEIFHHVNEMKLTKKSEKPHLYRELRKSIARVKTIIREKQLEKQQ